MDLDSLLGELLLNEELSDVRLIVENPMEKANFPAHSLVLKRRSPVIAKMLDSSDFIEGQTRKIIITDFKALHIEMFLRFLYTDTLLEMYTILCELVKIADKYLVLKLTERCEKSLRYLVNLQNVLELCKLADTYSLEKLLNKCLRVIKRAAFKLLKCDDLNCLSKEVMEKIVRADDLNVTKEIDVLSALWRWGNLKLCYQGAKFTTQDVIDFIRDLLKHVRWSETDDDDDDEYDLIIKLGITVDPADSQKEYPPRKPSSFDKPWFFNQCDILRLDDHASSCLLLKECFEPSRVSVNVMHAVSMNELPFYVVGVLFACAQVEDDIDPQGKLICSCESSNTAVEFIHFFSGKSLAITDTTSGTLTKYQEIMCEFPNPIEVRKNQKLNICIVSYLQFGSVQLQFRDDGRSVYSSKKRQLFVYGNVLGIKQIFLL